MPPNRLLSEFWLASRFIAAGLVNTAIGLFVILGLDLGLHVPPAIANGLGYMIGICVAWFMHRRFVFRAEESGWATKGKYLAAVTIAFSLNQLVLAAVGHVSGATLSARSLAQFFGVATYTVVQFVLMRTWVFRVKAGGS